MKCILDIYAKYQKTLWAVNKNYKTAQDAIMSVNKLCALFTTSLVSNFSDAILYVVQWNTLDNFLETFA